MSGLNDLVLVYLDRQPAFYARVEDINSDVKKSWYQVELLALTLPPQTLVWILEEAHIRGEEFTMGGRPVRLAPVPPKTPPPADVPEPSEKGKVIPLSRKP